MANNDTQVFSKQTLQEILVTANYISSDVFTAATSEAENDAQIVPILIASGHLNKDLWGQAMAEHQNVPYADLNSRPPNKQTVERIDEKLARQARVVIFDENDAQIVLTTDQVEQAKELVSKLQEIVPQKKISFAYSLSEDINKVLTLYRAPLQERLTLLTSKSDDVVPEILKEVFIEAKLQRASDIHFEPSSGRSVVRIRLRIDGVLQKLAELPLSLYENVLNRLKVLSNLRIDEHGRVQDGALRFKSETGDDDVSLEIRVSIAPTVSGEKVTLRVISEYIENFSPEALGMNNEQVQVLKKATRMPFGMVILCGPTGSGKTTTAYTMLHDIADESINITTIEDPVEYRMGQINQIQVHPAADITFAKGLRSIVRQDPDVIFVGEIRDKETAEISVNAALTGHLLFSTFHATSASATIPRLLEMDIEPFLLASTLSTVVAQRLVRKLCDSCRYSETVSVKDLKSLLRNSKTYFPGPETTLYRAKGCDACNGTGYRGRTVIVEILQVDEVVRDLITGKSTAKQIESQARSTGMKVLFEDGIEKVKEGLTSLEELLRVVEEPQTDNK